MLKDKSWHCNTACNAPPLPSCLLQTPVTYCAANTSDLECVVDHVKGLYPKAPVLGAGVSMGGWVGETVYFGWETGLIYLRFPSCLLLSLYSPYQLLLSFPILSFLCTSCSMLLLNYLARKRTESGMVAGFTISVPWDAQKSSVSMEEPLNWLLFNKYLTSGLCRAVNRSDKWFWIQL